MPPTAEDQERAIHFLQALCDLAKWTVQQPMPDDEDEARARLAGYLQLHFPEDKALAELQRAALYFVQTGHHIAYIIGQEALRRLAERN